MSVTTAWLPPGGALDADRIMAGLPTELGGVQVHVYDRVRSTNDTAAKLLELGDEPFLAVLAEQQDGGRGRRGRSWASPPGVGLLCTLGLAYPAGIATTPGEWPLLAALAVRRAIVAETGAQVSIKWPNDLLVDGKKVCGILTELLPQREGIVRLAIGVGINANTDMETLPAEIGNRSTSLSHAVGRVISRNSLACRLIVSLFDMYEATRRGARFADWHNEMLAHCVTLGQYVRVAQGVGHLEGVAQTIDAAGALKVLDASGEEHTVISGEIIQYSQSWAGTD